MHLNRAVQQLGHSTELQEVSLASTTGSSDGREFHSTSSGSSDFDQKDATSSDTDQSDVTSSGSAESFNTAAVSGGSRQKSKRAIRRPSYLEDYIFCT